MEHQQLVVSPKTSLEKPQTPKACEGKLECDICGISFASSKNLSRHRREQNGLCSLNKYWVKCHLCNKTFSKIYMLRNHMNFAHIHSKSRLQTGSLSKDIPANKKATIEGKQAVTSIEICKQNSAKHFHQAFVCDICERTFTRKDYLRKHNRLVHELHPSIDYVRCRVCKKDFARKYMLFDHFTFAHGYEDSILTSKNSDNSTKDVEDYSNKFICGICKVRFKSRSTLKKHLIVQHFIDKGNVPNQNTSNSHNPSPSNDVQSSRKNYTCNKCGFTFTLEQNLKRHLRRQHEGDQSKIVDYVTEHQQLVVSAKISLDKRQTSTACMRKFTCKICGFIFASSSGLFRHRREQNGVCSSNTQVEPEQPVPSFKISLDSKRTNSKDLKKKYTCDICGTKFTRNDNLRRHKRIVHTLNHRNIKNISNRDNPVYEHQQLVASPKTTVDKLQTPKPCNKEFTCDICGLFFIRLSNLTRHRGKEHEIDLSNKVGVECRVCKKKFSKGYMLRNHMKLVHAHSKSNLKTGNYSKDVPPKKNDTTVEQQPVKSIEIPLESKRTKAKQSHQAFACDICEVRFTRKEGLRRHRLKQHELNPNPTYDYEVTCRICKKKFAKNYMLLNHFKFVHGYDDSSLTSYNTNNHGEVLNKKHSCGICKMRFTYRNALSRHLLVQHFLGMPNVPSGNTSNSENPSNDGQSSRKNDTCNISTNKVSKFKKDRRQQPKTNTFTKNTHLRKTTFEKPNAFKKNSILDSHEKQMSTSMIWICPCDRSHNSKKAYLLHAINYHQEVYNATRSLFYPEDPQNELQFH